MSDWDSVTVLRKTTNATTQKSKQAINTAMRTGQTVISEKKATSLNSNQKGIDAGKAAKIDNETESFHVEKVGMSVSKAIQQARQAKGLTQKDLATKINEKPQVVNEYEAGKAINPNQQILMKLERALGVKLRGKDIGQPLASKK
jgi:putative transcription factor